MSLHRKFIVFINGLLAAACVSTPSFAQNQADLPPAVDKFIAQMVEKNHFEPVYLRSLFDQIHMDPEVTAKMDKPYESKPWTVYRNFFLTQDRIDSGVRYWHDHEKELARAEKIYGVPANVIVAIIGVESKFGTEPMKFQTFQTLATFAFNYPKRAPFFTSELENFLLMAREQKFNPLEIKGSYAGAMGIPQFMPSSYRHYAVNFAGGKKADILNNHADAISSIGNYLKRNGWVANQPVAIPVVANASALKNLKQEPLIAGYSLKELRQRGISWPDKMPLDAKASFFTVEFEDTIQPWVGLNNFIAISRYNHNMQYVLAVHELSQAIKIQRVAALREELQRQRTTATAEDKDNYYARYLGEAELMADSPTD